MILTSRTPYKSIGPIDQIELPDFVVITGPMASGKTHLLEGIGLGNINLIVDIVPPKVL